jgi:hypothetical protein
MLSSVDIVYRDAEGKLLRGDLQMTTLDLYDYKTMGDYLDPEVQVWDNVTFADNYYQTTSIDRYRGVGLVNTIPDGWLPDGSPTLSRADLNVDLSNRSGFAVESLSSGKDPRNNVLAWYAGTADLSLDGKSSAFGTPILRRKGDFSQDALYDGNTFAPWNTNDVRNVIDPASGISTALLPVSPGDADAQWEGVGIIIVENGNINFSQGNPVINNVTLITNAGSINLKSVKGTSLSLCASGDINFSGANQLAGNNVINSNGNTNFGGNNSMTNTTSQVKIVAQGNIEISGNTNLKGQLWTKKNFSASGSTTIVGAITAMDNVSINGNSTITG